MEYKWELITGSTLSKGFVKLIFKKYVTKLKIDIFNRKYLKK